MTISEIQIITWELNSVLLLRNMSRDCFLCSKLMQTKVDFFVIFFITFFCLYKYRYISYIYIPRPSGQRAQQDDNSKPSQSYF